MGRPPPGSGARSLAATPKPPRRRADGPPRSLTTEAGRYAWWLRHASRGDGPAMVEVAERLEAGRGVEQDVGEAVRWYQRAARAGVWFAAALVGETVFEAEPVAGIAWLMLAFERCPTGDDAALVLASTLALHEPRLTDEAIHAAQVLADACRERACWPDELKGRVHVAAPFRPRPPTPPLAARVVRQAAHLTKPVRFGPWQCRLPPAATVETVLVGQHLRASWGGVFTQHLVWATLAPGVDLAAYVRRSQAGSARTWQPAGPDERFLVRGVDTFSATFHGTGRLAGQAALKRFAARGDQVAVLTAVAPRDAFEARRGLLEAIADSLEGL